MKKLNKGQYERYYNKIRECLHNNMGVTEITEVTNLNYDEVVEMVDKIQKGNDEELNDLK